MESYMKNLRRRFGATLAEIEDIDNICTVCKYILIEEEYSDNTLPLRIMPGVFICPKCEARYWRPSFAQDKQANKAD